VATGPRAGLRVRRLGVLGPAWPSAAGRKARLDGFDLYAAVAVRAGSRGRLERLCRYLLRPPLAPERLERDDEGQVRLRLKTPWNDGTTHLLFDPIELLEKLAAIIPRPHINLVLYHGVLAARAKWRPRVVAYRPADDPNALVDPARAPRNRPWADLMRRSFGLDVLACPRCGGRLRLIATILDPRVARRILDHLGLRADPVQTEPARAPPDPVDAHFDFGA
jgi:hypothetical protein